MCMIINVKTNRPKGEESARTDGLTDWQQVQAGRQQLGRIKKADNGQKD